MVMNSNVKLIGDYLDKLFPNPKTELNFNCDYELLIAVMLSAQTTDKRVNEVTRVLFSKYTLKALSEADTSDLERILRPLGSFRKKALYTKSIAKILIDEYDGIVPVDKEVLIKFPGVGKKTAGKMMLTLKGKLKISESAGTVVRVEGRSGSGAEHDQKRIGEIRKD